MGESPFLAKLESCFVIFDITEVIELGSVNRVFDTLTLVDKPAKVICRITPYDDNPTLPRVV